MGFLLNVAWAGYAVGVIEAFRIGCLLASCCGLLSAASPVDLARLEQVEKQGLGKEKVSMARSLLDGDSFERDIPRAIRLLHAAALSGDEVAMEMLGSVMTNYKESEAAGYEWLLEAGKKGSAKAREKLSTAYAQGWLKGLNQAQLNWVRYWGHQAGNLQSGYDLAKSLLRKEWSPVAGLNVRDLLFDLANKGCADAMAEYTYQAILEGSTKLADRRLGLVRAAEGGSALGKWLLYRYYLENGTPAEKEKGRELLREASKAGLPQAKTDLAWWLVLSGGELEVRLGLADLRQISARMLPDADFYLYSYFISRGRTSGNLSEAVKHARMGWKNTGDERCGKVLAFAIADGLTASVSPRDSRDDTQELEKICRTLADRDPEMRELLGKSLVSGKVQPRSLREERSVLEAKVAAGDTEAMAQLGAWLEAGSPDAALELYLRGAQGRSLVCLERALGLLEQQRRHVQLLALVRDNRDASYARVIIDRLDALLVRTLRDAALEPVGEAESLLFYADLASKGDSAASLKLSRVYLGMAPPRYKEAVACLRFSLSQPATSQEARAGLYDLWRKGQYQPVDAPEQVSFYEADIRNGDRSSVVLNNLGVALHDAGDPVRSVVLYKQAIAAGNTMSIYNLAVCMDSGAGTPKDLTFAYVLFRAFLLCEKSASPDLVRKIQERVADYEARYNGSFDRLLLLANRFHELFRANRLSPEMISRSGLAGVDGRSPPVPETPPAVSPEADSVSTGSGMVFTREGHVFTNYHVIEGRTLFRVKSGAATYQARLVASDKVNDVAILLLDGWNNPLRTSPPRIALLRPTEAAGKDVFLWGFPLVGELSREPNFQKGSINAYKGGSGRANMIQVSAPMQSGNSGGPVCLDDEGGVVGLAVAKLMYADGEIFQNVNFAVRAEYLLRLAKDNGVPTDSDGAADRNSVKRHTVLILAK